MAANNGFRMKPLDRQMVKAKMSTLADEPEYASPEAIMYVHQMEMQTLSMRFMQAAAYGYFIANFGKALGLSYTVPAGLKVSVSSGWPMFFEGKNRFNQKSMDMAGTDKTRVPVMVKKENGGYTYTVPLQIDPRSDIFNIRQIAAWFGQNPYAMSSQGEYTRHNELAGLGKDLRDTLVALLGIEYFDVQKPYYSHKAMNGKQLDKLLAVTGVIKLEDIEDWFAAADYDFRHADLYDEEIVAAYPDWMRAGFRGFVLTAPPVINSAGTYYYEIAGEETVPANPNIPGSVERKRPTVVRKNVFSLADCPAEHEIHYIGWVLNSRALRVQGAMHMPDAVAAYATQTDPSKLDVSQVGRYCVGRFVEEIASNLQVGSYFHSQVKAIAQANKATPVATPVRPGVDPKSGLGLTVQGMPIFLPHDLDNLEEYEAEMRKLAETSPEGAFYVWDPMTIPDNYSVIGKPVTERPRPDLKLPSNKMLYVDWRNHILSYTNQAGTVMVEPIATYRPLNLRAVKIFLEDYMVTVSRSPHTDRQKKLGDQLEFILNYRLVRELQTYYDVEWLRNYTDFGDEVRASESDLNYAYSGIANSLATGHLYPAMQRELQLITRRRNLIANRPGTELEESFDDILMRTSNGTKMGQIVFGDIHPNSPLMCLRAVYAALMDVYKRYKTKFTEFASLRSPMYSMEEFGVIAIIVKYAPRLVEINDKIKADYPSRIKTPPEDWKPEGMACKKGYTMLPHQAKVDFALHDMPVDTHTVLNVQAGGGKTHMIWRDIALRMERGEIKRPLVVCPGYLLKNYVEDGNYIFDGKFNTVAINTRDTRDYKGDPKSEALGLEGIRAMILAAPRNTLFVTSYDFISPSPLPFKSYGTKMVQHNPNMDILLEAGFDYIAADESHTLRNATSGMSRNCAILFASIPNGTIATGTLLATRPEDIANQFRMINPAVFGTVENFVNENASDVVGGKIITLRPESKEAIITKMRKNSRYIQVKRTEWAALLPEREDHYHFIQLDKNDPMRILYDAVLTQVLDELKELVKKNSDLKKALQDDSDTDGAASEAASEDMESIMGPYLQRLEKLTLTPQNDPDFNKILGPDAKIPVSKKITTVIDICEKHIRGMTLSDIEAHNADPLKNEIEVTEEMEAAGGIPGNAGKILIFCNFNNSVDAIYDAMPADLKAMTLRYDSDRKDKDLLKFATDPNCRILVGIQTSLATGHNFQHATRLIRTECVWSPGELEQGDSRINRPDPKNMGRERPVNHFDWVAVNGTIDITKMSRLTSRLILNNMIDEQDNPRYKEVRQLPLVSMTMETIEDFCWLAAPGTEAYDDLKDANLWVYLKEKNLISKIQSKEYKEFREANPHSVTPIEVPSVEPPEDYALLLGQPFMPGQDIPNMKKLGLMRYSEFVARESHDNLDALQRFPTVGVRVYTTEGEGKIISMNDASVLVELTGGKKIRSKKLCTFVFTDQVTTIADIVAATGMKKVVDTAGRDITNSVGNGRAVTPDAAPPIKKVKTKPEIPAPSYKDVEEQRKPTVEDGKQVKTRQQHRPDPETTVPDADLKVEIWSEVFNGALGLSIDLVDEDVIGNEQFFLDLGFVSSPSIIYAELPNKKKYSQALEILSTQFHIDDQHLAYLREVERLFNVGKGALNVAEANAADIRDFYRSERKRLPGGQLAPYINIVDDDAYMILEPSKNPSAKDAKTATAGVLKWGKEGPHMHHLFTSMADCRKVLDAVKAKFTIVNKDELVAELRGIKITKKKL